MRARAMQYSTSMSSTTMRLSAAAAFIIATSTAHADVDWARGLVTAEGIGVANRAAPTPASARGPARRMAEEAARKKLAGVVGAVPIAEGGTVEAKVKADAAVKAAVEKAVANAIVIAAEPETDGSWKVTMAVPIEALRLAAVVGGPRTLASDDGAAVMVVEGAGATKPAVGYKVGGVAAAVVFVKEVPAWAKDAPRVKAKGAAKAGAIDAASGNATEATLFVI
ncbi:MAG: hypothetical protein H0T65_10205, partial [Deltaproteobacteria bacterium]|nr:hypothetical protein [Deltaproteobacteria bacterium]